jgi:hypothetical protein
MEKKVLALFLMELQKLAGNTLQKLGYTPEDAAEVACPKCGGAMYDNREKKATGNWRGPYFSCKNKACKGAHWQNPVGVVEAEPEDVVDDASNDMDLPF